LFDAYLGLALQKWESTKSIHYHLRVLDKDPYEKDTVVSDYDVDLKRLDQNSFGFKLVITAEDGFTIFYDGQEVIAGSPSDGDLVRVSSDKDPVAWLKGTIAQNAIVTNISGKNVLKSMRGSNKIIERSVAETGANSDQVIILDAKYGENEVVHSAMRQVVLRIQDFLPLELTQTTEYKDPAGPLTHFHSSRISQIELDPELNDSIFSGPSKIKNSLIRSWDNIVEARPPSLHPGDSISNFQEQFVSLIPSVRSKVKPEIYFLFFWYLSCTNCHLAVNAVNSIEKEFGQEKAIVLGINPIDQKSSSFVEKFLESRHIEYPQLFHQTVTDLFRVKSYPTFIIIKRNGTILYAQEGYDSTLLNKWREILNSIER
jgi:hypothetical protein